MKSDYNSKKEDYFSLSRPEIQQLIKPNQNTLLDVGCGAGEMAYELKIHKKINEVWGIELVESAGLKAKEKLDKVIISPVEKAIDELPDYYFDVIVFADVLEHLIEPQEILTKIQTKLKRNGEIIASIPNIRHWSIIKNLLEGNWDYTEFGLLDRTHLRFFTKNSIQKLFTSVGLKLEFVGSSVAAKIDIPDEVINQLISSGINAHTLKDEINHFQYFVKAVKANAVVVPIEFINAELVNNLSTLSNSTKENLKIIFLYEVKNELVDFINRLNDPGKFITSINKNDFNQNNYKNIISIKNPKISKEDLENLIENYL